MASLFGITSAKYQYAIDEYYRMKKEVCCTEVLQLRIQAVVVLCLFTCWCNSFWCLRVRGRKRKRKTACRRKQNGPLTSYGLRERKTNRSPWQTSRRWPPLSLMWPIRSRMKIRHRQAPSESPLSSRQPNHPLRMDVCALMSVCLLKKEHCLVSPSTVWFVYEHSFRWEVLLYCGCLARTVVVGLLLWLLSVPLQRCSNWYSLLDNGATYLDFWIH